MAFRQDIARAVFERTETSMEGGSGESKRIARGDSENSRGRGSTVQLQKENKWIAREGKPRKFKNCIAMMNFSCFRSESSVLGSHRPTQNACLGCSRCCLMVGHGCWGSVEQEGYQEDAGNS